MSHRRVPSIGEEFDGAELGDSRRSQRLVVVAEGLQRAPAASFPKAAGSDAALEGTYRLLANPEVTPSAILAPHIRATVARAAQVPEVLAIHDTTLFDYGKAPKRVGMGILRAGNRGFLAHVSLVLVPGEERLPLGVAALHLWTRQTKKPRLRPELRAQDPNRESKRWIEQAEHVEAELGGVTRVVHVMDRESDAYPLFARLVEARRRFVVRCVHERLLDDDDDRKLSEVLAEQPFLCERTVQISGRAPKKAPRAAAIHPPRGMRVARLAFAAATVALRRPVGAPEGPETLRMNVIRVIERSPPKGEAPIEWKLITSEPVSTAEEVLRVVDVYRSRWTVEDYFKAVKTGCAFAERQLETFDALSKALAIFLPIAWRMLLLRSLARAAPDVAADVALSPTQMKVLRAVSKVPLSAAATSAEAMAAIAALGGHIKNNGPPGWQVLGRGYHDLLLLELGWDAREKQM